MVLLKVHIEKLLTRILVTDEIEYLSAIEEEKYTIAQANTKLDKMEIFYRRTGFM